MTKIEWVKNPDGTQGHSWNPILGFDDYYATRNGEIRGPSGKVLKQATMPSGHLYVLCNRGHRRQRKLFVHRAVLLAFVGLPKAGEETRHLNGNPEDNRLENLVWGTRQENADDRRKHGRAPIPHESTFTKLTPKDIPIIRELACRGLSSRHIGQQFNTSHTTIQKIVRGERWKGY